MTTLLGQVCTDPERKTVPSQEERDRRYRIAPLEVELHEGKPERDFCYLPQANDAFPTGTKILRVVEMPDRLCWGLLLCHKSWLKIKMGNLIPILNVFAKVQND